MMLRHSLRLLQTLLLLLLKIMLSPYDGLHVEHVGRRDGRRVHDRVRAVRRVRPRRVVAYRENTELLKITYKAYVNRTGLLEIFTESGSCFSLYKGSHLQGAS